MVINCPDRGRLISMGAEIQTLKRRRKWNLIQLIDDAPSESTKIGPIQTFVYNLNSIKVYEESVLR